MDFAPSAKAQDYLDRLKAFMAERVFPAEVEYEAYRREKGRDDHTLPPVVEELKAEARARGLWNLFLPDVSGLTNVEYAPLAELTGWAAHIAPESSSARGSSIDRMLSPCAEGGKLLREISGGRFFFAYTASAANAESRSST